MAHSSLSSMLEIAMPASLLGQVSIQSTMPLIFSYLGEEKTLVTRMTVHGVSTREVHHFEPQWQSTVPRAKSCRTFGGLFAYV